MSSPLLPPVQPGIREIPDPQAEMERLAEARKQPACPVPGGHCWKSATGPEDLFSQECRHCPAARSAPIGAEVRWEYS